MTSAPKKIQLTAFLLPFILALLICGCASPTNKTRTPGGEEEAYIDLKHGFSLVLPSTWVREKIPVSSPRHRQNTVEWRISSLNGKIGTFQITTVPNRQIPLEEQLSVFNTFNFVFDSEKSKSILHPAGQAFHWEGQDDFEHMLLRAIQGEKRTFIITCKVSADKYEQLLPTLEKVISSLSILRN